METGNVTNFISPMVPVGTMPPVHSSNQRLSGGFCQQGRSLHTPDTGATSWAENTSLPANRTLPSSQQSFGPNGRSYFSSNRDFSVNDSMPWHLRNRSVAVGEPSNCHDSLRSIYGVQSIANCDRADDAATKDMMARQAYIAHMLQRRLADRAAAACKIGPHPTGRLGQAVGPYRLAGDINAAVLNGCSSRHSPAPSVSDPKWHSSHGLHRFSPVPILAPHQRHPGPQLQTGSESQVNGRQAVRPSSNVLSSAASFRFGSVALPVQTMPAGNWRQFSDAETPSHCSSRGSSATLRTPLPACEAVGGDVYLADSSVHLHLSPSVHTACDGEKLNGHALPNVSAIEWHGQVRPPISDKPKRGRRKRCGACDPCLVSKDCGDCYVCRSQGPVNAVCKTRKCVVLKRKAIADANADGACLEKDARITTGLHAGPFVPDETSECSLPKLSKWEDKPDDCPGSTLPTPLAQVTSQLLHCEPIPENVQSSFCNHHSNDVLLVPESTAAVCSSVPSTTASLSCIRKKKQLQPLKAALKSRDVLMTKRANVLRYNSMLKEKQSFHRANGVPCCKYLGKMLGLNVTKEEMISKTIPGATSAVFFATQDGCALKMLAETQQPDQCAHSEHSGAPDRVLPSQHSPSQHSAVGVGAASTAVDVSSVMPQPALGPATCDTASLQHNHPSSVSAIPRSCGPETVKDCVVPEHRDEGAEGEQGTAACSSGCSSWRICSTLGLSVQVEPPITTVRCEAAMLLGLEATVESVNGCSIQIKQEPAASNSAQHSAFEDVREFIESASLRSASAKDEPVHADSTCQQQPVPSAAADGTTVGHEYRLPAFRDDPSAEELLKHSRLPPPPLCGCVVKAYDENAEGPFYTQLGTASSIENVRLMMEQRTGHTGGAVRIEKVRFTGKEGRTSLGCPAAKWVLNRSGDEEKVLVCVRHRVGHSCSTAWIVIAIVCWEGVPHNAADHIYDYLVRTLPVYGYETERRCSTNVPRSCACQGWDVNRRGASFSYGCSWCVYYDGCKFARSKRPRKFRVREESLEEVIESKLQALSQHIGPLFGVMAPAAHAAQVKYEKVASDCRLGFRGGRPFSGVTATVDFCAHAHYDIHNMNNGSTVVVTLTKHRGLSKPDDQQLHVLPLYILEETDERGSRAGILHKLDTGAIEERSNETRELRQRSVPLGRKKKGTEKFQSPKVKEAMMRALLERAEHKMATLKVPLASAVQAGGIIEPATVLYGEQGCEVTVGISDVNTSDISSGSEIRAAGSGSDTLHITASNPTMAVDYMPPPPYFSAPVLQAPALMNQHQEAMNGLAGSRVSVPTVQPADSADLSSNDCLQTCQSASSKPSSCDAVFSVDNSKQRNVVMEDTAVVPPCRAWSAPGAEDHPMTGQELRECCSTEPGSGSCCAGDDTAPYMPPSPRPPSPELDDPEPRVIHEASERLFEDPRVGGVALALTHGAVLFEVAELELHATTALRQPDRYDPTRISLVFYQHKKLNYRRHGHYEYVRADLRRQQARREAQLRGVPYVPKGLKYKKKRQEEALKAAAASGGVFPRGPHKRKLSFGAVHGASSSASGFLGKGLLDRALAANKIKKKKKRMLRFAPYRWCWSEPVKVAQASTTNSVVTQWVKPECFVTGPYQRWISL